MPDDPYSIADLARLADVTPRTIRYYVSQGLLPSPEVAGPATRYGEGHLLRLRLIRRLQRDHLPLSEIRARLERMGDEEVRATLDADSLATPEPPTGTDATLAYVRGLMQRAGVAPRFYDRPAPALARRMIRAPEPAAPAPAAPELRDGPPPSSPVVPAIVPTPAAGPDTRPLLADRSTWERLSITPDVELHVRRPLDRRGNKRVERLIRIARELFEEEP